jgi:hypothetical protein
MAALYVGGQKVEWTDAGSALGAPRIDWTTVTVCREAGAVIVRVEPAEEEPEPLIVNEQNR